VAERASAQEWPVHAPDRDHEPADADDRKVELDEPDLPDPPVVEDEDVPEDVPEPDDPPEV
jgi:hypothetical protein